MAEKKLDLLEFAARLVAQTGAVATKVMRRQFLNASAIRRCLHDMPDRLRRDPLPPNLTVPVYTTEDQARGNVGSRHPLVNYYLCPRRHRYGTNTLPFSDQIRDYPVVFANLEVLSSKSDKFRSPETTCEQQC